MGRSNWIRKMCGILKQMLFVIIGVAVLMVLSVLFLIANAKYGPRFPRLFTILGLHPYLLLLAGLLCAVRSLRRPRRHPPKCNSPLPHLKLPDDLMQLRWKRPTCDNCGVEIKANFFGHVTGYEEPKATVSEASEPEDEA